MSDVIRQGGRITQVSSDDDRVKQLLRFKEKLEYIREPWKYLYEKAATYLVPAVADWDMDRSERGQQLGTKVYNSRPISSLNTVSGGLQGYLTPQTGTWLKLETVNTAIMERYGVRKYLEAATAHIMRMLPLNGFYSALAEAYPQLVGLGTSTVIAVEDETQDMLRFTTLHPKQVMGHEDRFGNIDTWVIELFMTRSQLIAEYGRSGLSTKFLDAAEEEPFADELITIFLMPRHVRDVSKIDNLNKPWALYHVFDDERVILRESGVDDPLAITGRWSKNSDEAYGRGWGLDVLADVIRLNLMTKAEGAVLQSGEGRATDDLRWQLPDRAGGDRRTRGQDRRAADGHVLPEPAADAGGSHGDRGARASG